MILPYGPRRHWLQSFAAVAGSGVAAAGLALLVLQDRSIVAAGLSGLGIGVIVTGQLRPQLLSVAYRGWNKTARHLAALIRRCTLALVFHLILRGVGLAGRDQLRLAAPRTGDRLWTRYPVAGTTALVESTEPGWVNRFRAWATQSPAQLWTLCLLPFLLILSAVERDRVVASSISADTYTLY